MRRIFNNISKKRIVFVVGLPNSGTSFLTGLISRLGFNIGNDEDIRKADQHNRFGYYENIPILYLNDRLIQLLEKKRKTKSFFGQIEIKIKINSTLRLVKNKITKDQIDLYKDTRFIVLADLYDAAFPNAQWIYISRPLKDCHRSELRVIPDSDFDIFKKNMEKELIAWESSGVSKFALNLEYDSFRKNAEDNVDSIIEFLELTISEEDRKKAISFFRPRK